MSRNSTGTYARMVDAYIDGGYLVAADHNAEHNDFGTEITDSLNRSGKGGMLAALKLYNGTVSSPGAHFTGQTNTGFYLNAAGDLRCAVAGADLQRWTAALVRIETALFVNGGIEGNSLVVSGNAHCGTLTCDAAATVGTSLTVTTTLGVTGLATFTAGADMTGDKIVNVGTPAASTDAATKGYSDTNFGAAILAFGAGALTNAVSEFLYPWWDPANASASEIHRLPVPFAGRISKMYIRLNNATSGDNVVYTVRKNGTATALTATLASGATSGSDLTHEFTVAAGDTITVETATGGSALVAGDKVLVTMCVTRS